MLFCVFLREVIRLICHDRMLLQLFVMDAWDVLIW